MNRPVLLHAPLVRLLRAVLGDAVTARIVARRHPELDALLDRQWYAAQYPDVPYDPLVHYLAFGATEGRHPHPLFDPAFYVGQYPEARSNALAHYACEGLARRHATHPVRGFCLIPPLGRPLRVLTLLVRYGTEKYAGADERLEGLMGRVLPGADRRTIIIDNALAPEVRQSINIRQTLIGGDNTSWEFSGWDRGLKFANEDLDSFDFIHFATDAFEQFEAAFPRLIDTRMLEALRCGPAVAGHIDFYNEPAELFARPVQTWIRSSFFFLRPQEVRALRSMVSIGDKSALFTGNATQPFRADSPVSVKLAGYLTSWLTGEGLGQGVQWHSRFDLREQTLPLFEAKSVAILNEVMLSARLQSLGCWMVDVTWLRGVLDGVVTGRLFEEAWQDQIRNRPA